MCQVLTLNRKRGENEHMTCLGCSGHLIFSYAGLPFKVIAPKITDFLAFCWWQKVVNRTLTFHILSYFHLLTVTCLHIQEIQHYNSFEAMFLTSVLTPFTSVLVSTRFYCLALSMLQHIHQLLCL